MPRVSLLITCYNRRDYIAGAVRSALDQTLRDFELIVWDDGSTDGSPEVAEAAAGGDPRARVVRGPHRGFCGALNHAAFEARGEYLGWIDSDDELLPEALERTIPVLDARSAVGMVYTQHVVIDDAGREHGIGRRCLIPYSPLRLLTDFMTFHFRLMRRSLFESVGGLDERTFPADDYDLCLRLSELTEIAHVPLPLYRYRIHRAAISQARRVQQIEASRDAIQRALERRKLSDEYQLDVQLVGQFRLREREP